MRRIVLDTNVVVAVSRSRQGASFAVLTALRQRRFMALLSVPLILEYEAVLKRSEQLQVSQRTADMTDAFLDAFCLFAEPVHLHYLWRPQTRDIADEMVLETALNGRADALVTLNTAESLMEYARTVAQEENVSMNQFFVTAIAEKVSALKTESYFRERQARGDVAAFDLWLAASPDVAADTDDQK